MKLSDAVFLLDVLEIELSLETDIDARLQICVEQEKYINKLLSSRKDNRSKEFLESVLKVPRNQMIILAKDLEKEIFSSNSLINQENKFKNAQNSFFSSYLKKRTSQLRNLVKLMERLSKKSHKTLLTWGSKKSYIENLSIYKKNNDSFKETTVFNETDSMFVKIRFVCRNQGPLYLWIMLTNENYIDVFKAKKEIVCNEKKVAILKKNVEFEIKTLPFKKGKYFLSAGLISKKLNLFDYWLYKKTLTINSKNDHSLLYVENLWTVL